MIWETTPPVDSVPLIEYFASSAAPAPSLLPVPGKPLIGTAFARSVTVGQGPAVLQVEAEEMAGRTKAVRPMTAKQADVLRI